MQLVGDDVLEQSSVVANSRMNRERGVRGVNSYERELGIDPIAFVAERLQTQGSAAWLDLCCGRGRALIDAARLFTELGDHRPTLHGIDLVNMFDPRPKECDFLRLEHGSLHDWAATQPYDLITCIHGLHYLGNKLEIIQRCASWLTQDGMFVAHLDWTNLKQANGDSLEKKLVGQLRSLPLEYDRRRHLLKCKGRQYVQFEWDYLGADDKAGPNCTGQEAVDSYYREKRTNSMCRPDVSVGKTANSPNPPRQQGKME